MIGWENNQGAYFINKLQEEVNSVKEEADQSSSDIGKMSTLTTTAKDTLVKAINEVDSHADTNASAIGTLASLNTSAKTNLVSAINEVLSAQDFTLVDTVIGTTNSVSVPAGWKELNIMLKIDNSEDFCQEFAVAKSNYSDNKTYKLHSTEARIVLAIASDGSATVTIQSVTLSGNNFSSTSVITVSKR